MRPKHCGWRTIESYVTKIGWTTDNRDQNRVDGAPSRSHDSGWRACPWGLCTVLGYRSVVQLWYSQAIVVQCNSLIDILPETHAFLNWGVESDLYRTDTASLCLVRVALDLVLEHLHIYAVVAVVVTFTTSCCSFTAQQHLKFAHFLLIAIYSNLN